MLNQTRLERLLVGYHPEPILECLRCGNRALGYHPPEPGGRPWTSCVLCGEVYHGPMRGVAG